MNHMKVRDYLGDLALRKARGLRNKFQEFVSFLPLFSAHGLHLISSALPKEQVY
jgi:hypothetical protein